MLRMAKHLIGNGHSISLWHDNWHPLGPLALKFGPRASHDSGLPHDSLVSSILQGNQWVFPTTQTIELNEIRNSLPPLTVSGSASIDNIVWTLSSNGKFTISSLWDHMRSHYPTVSWSHVVWFPAHIPKCSLITWLAILNRLNTEDRLVCLELSPPLAAAYAMIVKAMTISSLAAPSLHKFGPVCLPNWMSTGVLQLGPVGLVFSPLSRANH